MKKNDIDFDQRRAQRRLFARLSVRYKIVEDDFIEEAKTLIDSAEAKMGSFDTTLAFLGLSSSEDEINPALLEMLKLINRKLDILINRSEEDIIKDADSCPTYDISSESISMTCDIPVGKTIIASIDFRPAFDKIYFTGKVIRHGSFNDKSVSVVKFDYISQSAKQTIVYYMFALERTLIQQDRQ